MLTEGCIVIIGDERYFYGKICAALDTAQILRLRTGSAATALRISGQVDSQSCCSTVSLSRPFQ